MHAQKYIVSNNFSMHINVKHNMIHMGLAVSLKNTLRHPSRYNGSI